MPTIYLPHSNESIELDLLLAVCSELTHEWRESPLGADTAPMPIYNSKDSLDTRLAANPAYACSFDVACRLVSRYRNTMQATDVFFDNPDNSKWFAKIEFANGLERDNGSRRRVNCVQFTPLCLDHWTTLPARQRDAAITRAQALLNADAELTSAGALSEILPLLPVRPAPLAGHSPAPAPVGPGEKADRAAIVKALVAGIHDEPFVAMYRKNAVTGAAVQGWDKRLLAYHWPNPQAGYERTCAELDELARKAASLARAIETRKAWSTVEEADAVRLANDIFTWGGVPQNPETVTAANVFAVFTSALDNDARSQAPMNSGWTKVAAFATAHLEQGGGKPQVIWDSRVATALIGRLDRLAQAFDVDPAAHFADIGTVPGRGGSRPRAFSLRWPAGYRRWSTQVSGSGLVREIRDILNAPRNGYPRMPLAGGATGNWTTRGVEMVLFMDGY